MSSDIVNSFVRLLLCFSFARSGRTVTNIRKCCPSNKVLDSGLEDCAEYNDEAKILSRFKTTVNCPLNDRCDLNYDGGLNSKPIIGYCPMKKRTESKLIGIENNQTLMIEVPSGIQESRIERIKFRNLQICTDFALNYLNELEGPFVFHCSNIASESPIFINKCCPQGYYARVQDRSCHRNEKVEIFKLPNRMVKHPLTGASTRAYSLKETSEWMQDSSCYFRASPKEIYLNGDASFKKIEESIKYRCLDTDSEDNLYGLICPQKPMRKCPENAKICIPKCCELNEIFHSTASRCVRVNDSSLFYKPKFHSRENGHPYKFISPSTIYYNEFRIEHLVKEECGNGLYKVGPEETIYLLDDGKSLYHEGYETSTSGFCVDNFVKSIESLDPPLFSAFKCVELNKDNDTSVKYNLSNFESDCESKMRDFKANLRIVYTVCGALSLLFLLITFLVYSTLPNFRNLHGKIVMSNIVAIFFTTLFLILAYNSKPSNSLWCALTGYSLYYSGLAMFCWMSVMCFDLCWTFVRAKIPRKGSDRLKFTFYSAFSWIIPGGFCGFIGILKSFSPELDPEIGKYNCFLSMKGARRFFYLPILILLCFNVLMYFITVCALWKSQRYSRKAGLTKVSGQRKKGNHGSVIYTSKRERGGHQINTETREQLILFTKLFLIMGLTWISECIHVEIHGDHQDLKDCNFYLEVILRIIGGLNVLRGFGFFIIFICKHSVLKSFKEKYPSVKRLLANCFPRYSASSPTTDSPRDGDMTMISYEMSQAKRPYLTRETRPFTSQKSLEQKTEEIHQISTEDP